MTSIKKGFANFLFTIQNVPIKSCYNTTIVMNINNLQYKMFLLNFIFLKLPI